MSTTLSFYDAAWESARTAAAAGRRSAALTALTPLVTGPDAPTRLALLGHRLAARLHAHADRYAKARRHLYMAAKLDAGNAEIHHEIGLAFELDPYGCDRRAARRFKRAAALAPRNAAYAASLGRALVRINRLRSGAEWLDEAAAMAPTDRAVVAVAVDGLCDAGRVDDATAIVARARFLKPADKGFRRLWDVVRFAAAREGQQRSVKAASVAGPKLLPFLRVVTEGPAPTGGVIRRDAGSRSVPHVGRLTAYRAERG